MAAKDQFLSKQKRFHPISLPQEFSDEEMARDWTISENDINEINKHRTGYRLFIAIQLCSVRLYGRFLREVNDLSPRIISYLNSQLSLPPSLAVQSPDRKATFTEYRKNILTYLGFRKFNDSAQQQLQIWLEEKAKQGILPNNLFHQAEKYLLASRTLLPGPSVLERLIIHVCSTVHAQLFESIYQRLSLDLQRAIDDLLAVPKGKQRSYFSQLKAYPPAAKISSLRSYLKRYQTLLATGIGTLDTQLAEPAFQDYLFKLTKKYSAKEIKRFKKHKRYALMVCFLMEVRKVLLDHLVKMHDQYMMEIYRQSKNAYEKKHRVLRKRQKRAVDMVLNTTAFLLHWPDDKPFLKQDLWQQVDEAGLRTSLDDLRVFKKLEERGYGDLILARYPSLRKYFADFLHLPFAAEHGSDPLLKSIRLILQLDANELKKLPKDAPTAFVPTELRRALRDDAGNINRNAWEMGLALAIKDALLSGDLYLPQSKQHVSFWNLMLNDSRWRELKEDYHTDLHLPRKQEAKTKITQQFRENIIEAQKMFALDKFAEIQKGELKLKRADKAQIPDSVIRLQSVIDASMPSIRIEQLLMEVDQLTHFSQHFTPI